VLGEATEMPIFAHVNWFQRAEDGRYIWPGYRENLRALLWLLDLKEGRVRGRATPIGVLPVREELRLEGLDIAEEDLERVLDFDAERWREEVRSREEHLAQFPGLPEEIWTAHYRLAQALAAHGAGDEAVLAGAAG
jgi:phosphoenolpyruvate carboxykinase (GTP)